jgi:uracil-DNA glycosylase
MRVCDGVRCDGFPCGDVRHAAHHVPAVEVDPASIRVVLISEAVPADPADGYEAAGDPLFARTTLEAFRDAGFDVATIDDVRALGVHLTTAVKCAKTADAIEPATIRTCSALLERELALFPAVQVMLLMGDVAVRALNEIARRNREPRPVPAGATYRIRGGDFGFRGARVFPSYLQAGPAFYIEKSKRRMIAEDLAAAMRHARAVAERPRESTRPRRGSATRRDDDARRHAGRLTPRAPGVTPAPGTAGERAMLRTGRAALVESLQPAHVSDATLHLRTASDVLRQAPAGACRSLACGAKLDRNDAFIRVAMSKPATRSNRSSRSAPRWWSARR